MRFSDMVFLKEGIFQLEEGHGRWNPDQCETVVILFAGSETELAPERFEDDEEVFLPSSLEDCHLRTAEVHHQGWYVETALEQVEELAPAILDFLPDMLIGQKVMILDTHGHKSGGKIYVVKLMSVQVEARTKLSPPEQILFNAVHELKPRTEAEWATVAAKWTHDIWREIMERFESAQHFRGISVQDVEVPHLVTNQTAGSDFGSFNSVSQTTITKRLKSDTPDGEAKKKVEPENTIPIHNLSIAGTPNDQVSTCSTRYEEQEVGGKANSMGRRKRWSSIYQQ